MDLVTAVTTAKENAPMTTSTTHEQGTAQATAPEKLKAPNQARAAARQAHVAAQSAKPGKKTSPLKKRAGRLAPAKARTVRAFTPSIPKSSPPSLALPAGVLPGRLFFVFSFTAVQLRFI